MPNIMCLDVCFNKLHLVKVGIQHQNSWYILVSGLKDEKSKPT